MFLAALRVFKLLRLLQLKVYQKSKSENIALICKSQFVGFLSTSDRTQRCFQLHMIFLLVLSFHFSSSVLFWDLLVLFLPWLTLPNITSWISILGKWSLSSCLSFLSGISTALVSLSLCVFASFLLSVCIGQGLSYLQGVKRVNFRSVKVWISVHMPQYKLSFCALLRHFDLSYICVSLQISWYSCALYMSPMHSSWLVTMW